MPCLRALNGSVVLGSGVNFVIAETSERSRIRPQSLQMLEARIQRITFAADQVSRHESNMSLRFVRESDGACKQALAHERTQVNIAKLNKP